MKHVLRLEFEAFTNMENLIEQHCNNKDYNCVFFQRGFIDSMNKIFKVVWSKTKECYVVVSEVAKNNSGKKKVLASVLAALAVVGAGAAQVDAASYGAGGGNAAADASISIGGGYSGQHTAANDKFAIAIGDNASATGKSSISMGYKAETNGQVSIAIGEESKVKKSEGTAVGPGAVVEERFGAAFGHEAKATKQYATAIGSGAQGEGEDSQAIGREAQTTGYRAVAVGTLAKALNNSAIAIGQYTKADGTNSIAMGKSSKAHSFDAIAIGHNNNSRTYSAISIGTDNTSDVAYGLTDAQFDALKYDEKYINDPDKTDPRRGVSSTIAIGRNNVAGNVEAIAIGTETKATKTDAIAIGARAEATGDYALAIGGAAGGYKVTADEYGTAVGVRSNAANRGAAFGAGSNAGSQKSVAIGYTAKASAQKATSNYEFSGSHGTPSPAGYNTETITVNSASAPAGGAVAGNYYDAGSAVAIGDGATVSDESDRAVVVGAGAKTNGNAHYSVVLGSGSHADASDGFVAGHGSSVASRESIAIGSGANVSGTENIRSQAIGFGATVSGTKAYDATAIGATAQVTGVQGGVALGSGSLLSRTTASNENIGWNSKYVDGTVVRNRAYKAKVNALDQWDAGAQIGAVSVGNDTQKRQIINVAAGNQDTDAVNVAQLKNVGVRVGADTNTATIGTNKVAADFLAYNGQLNIKGDNNRVTTVSENDANGKDANVNVKFDYNGLVKAKTGSAVKVDQKTDAAGKTYFEIDAAAGGATSTESVVKKAAATNDTNIADISVADNKNTGDVGAKYEVSVSRNAVKDAAREAVTVNNGGTTKADAVTFDGNKAAKQIPLTYKANGNGAKTVTLEKGLNFTNGTNTTAEIDNDGVVKYNLNKDVDLTNAGSLTVGGTKVNNDGITIKAPTTPGTTTTDVKLTNTGLDNGGNKITNVAEGTNNTDAVNVKQLKENRTEVKAGDNVVVTSVVDATDNHTVYTVNAVTPAVYTTPDGTKLTKDKDGKFHKEGESTEYTGDIITSFENPKAATGQTTKDGGMIVNNVGSAIKNQTGATYLDKLKAAADNNSTVKNAVVNVSDLKNTSDAIIDKGLRFDANEGNEKTNKLGSKVTVQGSGAVSSGKAFADEYNTANIRTNISQNNGDTVINVGLAKALKDINSVSNGSSSITLNSNPGGTNNTPAVSITGGNVDVGGNNITNLKSGGDTDSNAANIGDVKKIASDTDTHIKPGTYTVAADKTVTMTYVNGKGETVKANGQDVVAKIDLSGLPTGGTSSTEKVQKAADATGDKNIAEVGPKSGDTFGAADATYEVSVSRNAVKDAAREAVTVNNGGTTKADGSYTADSNNPISVTPTKDDNNHNTSYAVTFDGTDQTVKLDKGLNFTGGNYTTASVGADGKVTFDVNLGTTPTVTDGKPGVPGQDGIATVKTVVDTINNSGWKANAKANGGKLDGSATATVVKPGNTVNYAAGKNLIVNQELEKDASNALTGNQTYTYSLNKDIDLTNAGSLTVGDTTVNNGGITIKAPTPAAGTTATTTDVKLTNTGLDNGGNTITNVAEGQNNTDAVNVKQLKANRTEVKAGDNVVVTTSADSTDNHTVYTVNAVTPAVYTTPDGTKLTKDKDGKFHKEGETAEYTGNIITSFENPKAATGQTTKDGGMIVNNIGSAIKNQTPTMPAGQTATYLDKLKAAADDNSNVKNAAVNVSDLHNTAEALRANELHIAPTAVKANSTEVKGGELNTAGTENVYKYDASTKKVTLTYNDGNGKAVTDTKAVIDFSALNTGGTTASTWTAKTSAENTTAGSEVGKHIGDTSQVIDNQNSVDFQAGRNMTVKQTNDGNGNTTINYALDKDLTNLDKVVVNGKDGIAGKDGVTIVGPQGATGAPGIPGTPGTPGANIDISTDHGTQTLVKPEANNNDKSERIVYVPKDSQGNPLKDTDGKNIVREVATMDDGLKFGGDMGTVGAVKLNKQVDVKGGITDTNKLATGNNIGVTSVPDTTTGNTALNIQLAKDLTGLNSVELGGNTIKTDGDHITITTPSTTPGGNATVNKVANLGDELHITPGTYEVGAVDKDANAKNDEVTLTYTDGNSVEKTNTFAKIKGVANSNLSNISNDGKKVITGLSSVVKAGDNVTVSEKSDATTGQKTYTVNAVTPAVYTKADGTKVYKIVDPTTGAVTWNTSADGNGTSVNANEVIASFETPASGTTPGATTGGTMIVNNIGSAISGHEAKDTAGTVITSPTYLQRLETAAGDNLTKHAAVNVSDLN
ncbi:MAG: ESPR-type extended signal peptide-containing protein, partial [Veillonella sp.]|nr:ESPR-type extended signal peptide-containing protein [Veillonella sp.]